MKDCHSCDFYRSRKLIVRCTKGHGGLFRLAVINGSQSCPDYDQNPVITSIEVHETTGHYKSQEALPPSGQDGQ